MQKDFHYCAIRALAETAGFPPEDAQVIAYASQYVDDATEHKGLDIADVPPVATHCVVPLDAEAPGRFEPVCTAHKGIQYLSGIKPSVQCKVYIPFHFVPAERYPQQGTYDYRVRPGGPLIQELLLQATRLWNHDPDGDEAHLRRLVKLGIALHGFADTWSHQRFSGRWNAADNDIERIALRQDDGAFERLGLLDQIKRNLIPDIGHAEAVNFPDQSHLVWRYEHDHTGIEHTRVNSELFLEAAETIFNRLRALAPESRTPWRAIAGAVRRCLTTPTDSVSAKFQAWSDAFPRVDFHYDPEDWRSQALDGDRWDWDHFRTADDYATLSYRAKGDLKWFLFHVEAAEQRRFVRGAIRGDLL